MARVARGRGRSPRRPSPRRARGPGSRPTPAQEPPARPARRPGCRSRRRAAPGAGTTTPAASGRAGVQVPDPAVLEDGEDPACRPVVEVPLAGLRVPADGHRRHRLQRFQDPGPPVDAGSHEVRLERVRTAARRSHAAVGGVDGHDGLRTWPKLADVEGRVEVRGRVVQHGHLARPVEVDAHPVTCGVAQLEPAHVGVAAVLLWPHVGHELVGHRRLPAADAPAPLAVRVRLVRSRAEPGQRLEARSQLEHRPDPRQVGEDVRDHGSLLGPDATAAIRGEPGLERHLDAGGGRPRRAERDGVGPPARRRASAGAGRRAPIRPSGRPCRRSGRCRSGRARAPARAAPRGWGGQAPVDRRARRRSSRVVVELRVPWPASPASICAQPTSNPAGAHAVGFGQREPQRDETLAVAGLAAGASPAGRPPPARRARSSGSGRSRRRPRASPSTVELPGRP